LNFTLLLYKKQVAKAPLHNFYTRSRDILFINNFTKNSMRNYYYSLIVLKIWQTLHSISEIMVSEAWERSKFTLYQV